VAGRSVQEDRDRGDDDRRDSEPSVGERELMRCACCAVLLPSLELI
jgi:hypothetical protein